MKVGNFVYIVGIGITIEEPPADWSHMNVQLGKKIFVGDELLTYCTVDQCLIVVEKYFNRTKVRESSDSVSIIALLNSTRYSKGSSAS